MFGNWLKTSILMAAILALFGILGAFILNSSVNPRQVRDLGEPQA